MKKVCIYIQITFQTMSGIFLSRRSSEDLSKNQHLRLESKYYSCTYIFFPSPPCLSHPLFVHKKMQEGSTYLVWKCSIDTLFHSLLKKPELSVNSHPSLRWPEAISLKTSQGATLQIGRKHKYEFCMRGDVGWALL